jgi:hypothetical protein
MKPVVRMTLLLSCAVLGGCNVLGVIADKLPQPPEPAKVNLSEGLEPPKKDQPAVVRSTAVIVWTDRAINIDWSTLRGDLSSSVLSRLKKAQTEKAETLVSVTFPYSAEQVVRWQRDNPASDALPVTEVAKMLKVDRLIYVEVNEFRTRTAEAFELYRGHINMSIKVIDSTAALGPKVIYDEGNIAVHFPRTAPEDGTPRGSDAQMYVGVIAEAADEITRRFVASPAKE